MYQKIKLGVMLCKIWIYVETPLSTFVFLTAWMKVEVLKPCLRQRRRDITIM